MKHTSPAAIYRRHERIADRASLLLYARMKRIFHGGEGDIGFYAECLNGLLTWTEPGADDAYLRNLFFMYIGSRSEEKPYEQFLKEAEKLRLQLLEQNANVKKSGRAPFASAQTLTVPGDKFKTHYLMRLAVVARLARMIYKKLLAQPQSVIGKRFNKRLEFDAFPPVLESQLRDVLNSLRSAQ